MNPQEVQTLRRNSNREEKETKIHLSVVDVGVV
jgi:hypothetical protein